MRKRAFATALPALITAAVLSLAGAVPASASTQTYTQVLDSLSVATPNPAGYERSAFTLWIDADHDGCDTRAEVLKAESLVPVTTNSSCTVQAGEWNSWYDGATWTNASDVDIDHLVPLAEAWASGAYAWTAEQREAYANDLAYDHTLEAVTDNVNQSKGDRDPAAWLPALNQCRYAQYWVTVKDRWNLTVDAAERAALDRLLSGTCGADVVTDFPPKAGTVVEPGDPAPAVERYAGADRYSTAVAVSQHYPAGVPVAYIATGLSYPDALSAAPAAAAQGGPLLLTAAASVPSVVQHELVRLKPQHIIVVGGTSVVSAKVYSQLEALAPSIERYAGADRYATSRIINQAVFASGAQSVFVATGQNYPDALTASAVAGGLPGPVVLVPGNAKSINSSTAWLLSKVLQPSTIDIAGGTAVVSTGIENSLRAIATTYRYSGADRYATSQAINAAEFESAPTVYFATGTGFADALAGAAIAGRDRAPLFVVPSTCVPSALISRLAALGTEHRILLGGTSALSTGVQSLTACASPAPTPTPTPPTKPANPGDVRNCSDFQTYQQAYSWYITYVNAGYGDVAKLDADHDGIPCESLPGAP